MLQKYYQFLLQLFSFGSMRSQSKRSFLKFISLSIVCCFIAISCAQAPNNTQAPANSPAPNTTVNNTNKAGRVSIGTTLKLKSLDPADAYEVISGNLLYNLGDRLYTYKTGTTELIPQLATALPTISEDGLTYTIPIRSGVLFHDGTPCNAEAIAFSLNRFMENGGGPAFLLKDASVESITATGEQELTIKLSKPFAAFTSLLAFSGLTPVSPKVYKTGPGAFQPSTFVGTGPYKLTEYGTDVLRFEPFAQYWGEKPQNLGVDIRIFSSAVNLFNAFKTGEIDIAYLSLDPQQIETLKKEAATQGWQAIATDSKTVNYMVLNVKSAPLDKIEVRQALAAVLNRSLIINRVLQNQAEPVYSTVLPQFDVYQPVFEQLYGKDGNLTKAQELLTQAGFSATNPAVIEIWYPSSSSKRGLTGNTLKAIADKELGGMMQLKLNSVEATTAYQNLEKGVYQTFLLDWYGDYFDPDAYIQPFLYCSKGSEATGCEEGASKSQGSFYYNTQVNQLIDDQRRELDPVKRKAIFQELQNFLGKDVPYIPFWLDKDYVFAQKNITGVKVEPSQQFPWWSIQKN